jgi:hypothetical protein
MKKTKLEIGDRVAYSVNFLQSIAAYTGPAPFMRGIIKSFPFVSGDTRGLFAMIAWDDIPDERMVNVNNLAKVGSREFREAV